MAVNGYGVIGKRVADAVSLPDDMTLAGVADEVRLGVDGSSHSPPIRV